MEHIAGLKVDRALALFAAHDLLPGTGIDVDRFWQSLSDVLAEFGPKNQALLDKRADLQSRLTQWYRDNPTYDLSAYKTFLMSIGYLVPEPPDFTINPHNIDPEIAKVPGPQLVVPVMNARFALNAANARWGSLYDALYGTDVINQSGDMSPNGPYNPKRGTAVIAYGRTFLDEAVPLRTGSHHDLKSYDLNLELKDQSQLIGYQGSKDAPTALLLQNHGLHVHIQLDVSSPIGRVDKAGVKDILLESALTTIQDCEDSVAAVDGDDKALVYAHWLGLIRGDLTADFTKNGKNVKRRLADDRTYMKLNGQELILPGRALLLVRNVGHLMTTPAVLDQHNEQVPEGIVDAFFTAAAALHDLKRPVDQRLHFRAGSIYIVKPKMHGPEEVAFAADLFSHVECAFDLPQGTIKMGLMDEERRTTLNLPACIHTAKDRIFFINTGFLDRTGDEIHTSMVTGPMVRKEAMRDELWIAAYEDWNVEAGLRAGFAGRAQIGKGMWAKPDAMAAMMQAKIEHPQAAANTAWVPSPTAATLHAMHYHQVDVRALQDERAKETHANLDDLLTVPRAKPGVNWSPDDIQAELDNNAQGLLGYVVRWIDQGVGCSKVPDIHDVGLMEDRATLRISSQHMANWLAHGVVTKDQIMSTLIRMAKVVDQQNSRDSAYKPMSDNLEGSIAFQAACDLVFRGGEQPSGYTEPLLHMYRLKKKTYLKGVVS